jgi:hypothetical protein
VGVPIYSPRGSLDWSFASYFATFLQQHTHDVSHLDGRFKIPTIPVTHH